MTVTPITRRKAAITRAGPQTDTDIGARGQQALAETELGKEMRKSFINNPADKIDYGSDMIKRSDDIRKDVDVIAAGVGPKCVKQVVNKVTYTSHSSAGNPKT